MRGEGRVIVLGDLMLDTVVDGVTLEGVAVEELPPPRPGGTAWFAAKAFSGEGFQTCVIGRVGDDPAGRSFANNLSEFGVEAILSPVSERGTSRCFVILPDSQRRWMLVDSECSNDYDLGAVSAGLAKAKVGAPDLVLIFLHVLARHGVEHAEALVSECVATGARVVLDVVPHDMSRWASWLDVIRIARVGCHGVIIEYQTAQRLRGIGVHETEKARPERAELADLMDELRCELLMVRYGIGSVGSQVVVRRSEGQMKIERQDDTGFAVLKPEQRLGFGDRLTAATLRAVLG